MNHGADLLGRVVQAVDIRGVDDLDLGALALELGGNVFGNLLHARHILAAGLDMHQVAQRIEVGLLLFLGQLQQLGLRGSVGCTKGQCQCQRSGAENSRCR